MVGGSNMKLFITAIALLSLHQARADPACLVDVVFCLDNSGSIGNSEPNGGSNWAAVLDFAIQVTRQLNVAEAMTHVALVDFDQEAFVDFVLDTYKTESEVTSAIGSLQHRGRFTDITAGLAWSRRILTNSQYGKRGSTIPKVIVLVSDGNANVHDADLMDEAALIKASNIRIITAGVTSAVNENQMRAIASSASDYVHISDPTSVSKIKGSTILSCPTIQPTPPSTTPSSVTGSAGATYIRWGRRDCPEGVNVVYTGYAAGSHYAQVGSGHEYLCVPETPQWGKTVAGEQGWTGFIWGTEYELDIPYNKDKAIFSQENNGNKPLHDNDVPCVACANPNAYTTLMIPAIRNCSIFNWNQEYSGYLVSTDKTFYASQYICMDGAPQTRPGGELNLNGALVYPVQARCGSLPCPKYVESWEVTCSVCSK